VTDIAEPLVQPPRWARAFLLLALPCDPMRDAILGDLHEEFLDDAIEHGTRSARARYVRRTVGIAVRALSDAMIWREWVSTGRIAEPQLVTKDPRAALPRVSAAGGFAGFVVVALIVLAVAVVVNTILFSANAARHAHASSAAGVGGVALLVASVCFGAIVMCAGPRWRRTRRR